jgi:hypothetical protein
VEGRRLTKRQVRIPKPNLYHEPSDGLDSPFLGGESPKSKEQPRETDGRNADKKYEFSCHSTESATYWHRQQSNVKEGRPTTYRITTLLETMKNASLTGSYKSAPKQNGSLSDLGKRMQAPQARMSKPRSDIDPMVNNGRTG